MAKAKVVHSQDAVTVLVKGDPRSPEPGTSIIKFPGGNVEVTRCSDGKTYWAHISLDEETEILDSRLGYYYGENEVTRHIHDIADHEQIRQLALRVEGKYKEADE